MSRQNVGFVLLDIEEFYLVWETTAIKADSAATIVVDIGID